VEVAVAAKGGGSENKTKFVMLNPSDSLVSFTTRLQNYTLSAIVD